MDHATSVSVFGRGILQCYEQHGRPRITESRDRGPNYKVRFYAGKSRKTQIYFKLMSVVEEDLDKSIKVYATVFVEAK